MNIKQVTGILALLAAGVLAIVVARHLNAEALAVVVGVVCGVAAAIPTSLLLLVVLTRSERRQYEKEEQRRSPSTQYPPVVVIRGSAPQSLPAGPQPEHWLPVDDELIIIGGR